MEKKALLQIGNIIAVILTVIINALSSLLPLNNITPGELSDAIPNFFVPAGLTFSIWSVIYVLLFIFAFYQAKDLFKKEKQDLPFLDQISYLFIIASAANIAWIFCWHYFALTATYLSLIAMLVLLVTLLLIYLRLGIGKSDVDRKVKLYIHLPFSVYLGWITVATIANVTAVLVQDFGVPSFDFNALIWTILVIIVATIITGAMILTRKDIGYTLVILWAFLGIIIKRLDPAYLVQVDIAITAIIASAVLVGMLVIFWIRRQKTN